MDTTEHQKKLYNKIGQSLKRELTSEDQNKILKYITSYDLELNDEDDIDAAADSFLNYCVETSKPPDSPKKPIEKENNPKGSWQILSIFAGLQPLILEARQDILGTHQPLSWKEIREWLKTEEEKDDTEFHFEEFHFKFIVPPDDTYGRELRERIARESKQADDPDAYYMYHLYKARFDDLWEKHHEHFPAYSHRHTPLRRETQGTKHYSWTDGIQNHFVILKTKRLVRLALWAEEMHEQCPFLHFEKCIALILHGNMYSLNASAKPETLFFDRADVISIENGDPEILSQRRRSLPYLTFTIPNVEMSPKALSDFHSHVRKKMHYEVQGRPLSKEAEVLGIAALQLIWVDALEYGGRAFFEATKAKYKEIADFYHLDPDYYDSKTYRAIEKALKRIEDTCFELSQSIKKYSIFPDQYGDVKLFQRL